MVKRNWKAAGSWTKKMFLALGMGLCIAGMGTFPSHAAGQQVGTVAGHPIFDNTFNGVDIEDGSDTTLTKRGVSFATKYDQEPQKRYQTELKTREIPIPAGHFQPLRPLRAI